MNPKNHILFLSANDFKAKSIQVLRKTPEAFVSRGWDVKYIVSRDYSKAGNYYYEEIIDIEGVEIERFPFSFTHLRNITKNKFLQTFFSQIAGYITIIKLAFRARKAIKQQRPEVIYGYEVFGVCAVNLLKFFGILHGVKIVSRFQGTWINLYFENNYRLKLILNWDDVLALKSYADLSIMTNDGTKGDIAMKRLKSRALHNLKFWINGVDEQILSLSEFNDLTEKYKEFKNHLKIVSVSRLEEWKRIDRIIKTLSYLVNELNFKNVKYFLIGDGRLRSQYEKLIEQEKLNDYIIIVGGLPHNDVKKYLNFADIFISTYDLSNVGNPLLEAIRAHKIIFTLNNGDTSSWIKHKINGFIYDVNTDLYKNMANDLLAIANDNNLRMNIISQIEKTEAQYLWDWNQRLNSEVDEVEKLLY